VSARVNHRALVYWCIPNMTVSERIRVAEGIMRAWGDRLRGDEELRRLLDGLREKVSASRAAHQDLGVFEACRHCDEEEGGSCCGAGIEDRYSPHLLLLHLLLGGTLPPERCFADSCYFLEPGGCVLKVRDILCINYLCDRIQKRLSADQLARLQAVMGFEMDAVFKLHERVKEFLRSLPSILDSTV
jgi:hypothetical protein